MPKLNNFLTLVPTLPIDHLNALIALGGLKIGADKEANAFDSIMREMGR